MESAPVREELIRQGYAPGVTDQLIADWRYRIEDARTPDEFIDKYLPKPIRMGFDDVGLNLRFCSDADRVKFLTKVRDLRWVRFDWPWREGEKFEDAKVLAVEFLEATC